MNTPEPVAFIGLGPMGRAMVGALLSRGHRVTVWNRTPSRADALVGRGAVRAASPAEAVTSAELVILSLTDYDAMYSVLDTVGDALAGRTVVNLSSDSPARTREAARWLADRGADLLVGGVMVPAPMVGTEAARVHYSGPRRLLDAHHDTLAVIGRPDYRGEDHGVAQLWYQAELDVFLTMLNGFAHAAALLDSAGVEATELAPYAAETLALAGAFLDPAARAIVSGVHTDDGANVTMMGASADHVLAASRDAGIDTGLPGAVKAHYDWARAAGYGDLSWTSLYTVIRRPPER
ncbi:3-hydroxyisobutyrate dehydrogenase-like beta-hydroxyacid dehydrogenase [Stackebrandtia albiflava]|uniref:3-hydroxyisobutyrate dehydrogenase-like beta-hydroxyacid dehydrogenase n=1 Tax=Stackebrandtia albiflava TaxID=406432 RepID=A0A562VAX3_9ACTN|nr:NAD(P)-binding domain-containing protein [Stackebrandtia albiflava]TWJ15015.1 3-hydroxyisobutyrate dehydrogenase-like beta-hydroxyacid dehydrogenase [Stackebrandtia albiflava]